MSARLADLQPFLRPWATWLITHGNVQVSSVRRTYQEQVTLYNAYLRGESKYPAAPPGRSLHEQGRAFDVVGHPAELRRLGMLWESVGGRWGGRFGDPIHFEA